MAGHLAGGLRQAEYPAILAQNLPGIHRKPHQTSHRKYPSGEADLHRPAKALQETAGIWPGGPDRSTQQAKGAQRQDRPQHQPDDLLCLQLRGRAADHHRESHQRLCPPEAGEEGNENSSSGLPYDIFRGSKA